MLAHLDRQRWLREARKLARSGAYASVEQPSRSSSSLNRLDAHEERINRVEARIAACHKASAVSQRLATIPGIGPLTATAITATVADPAAFRSGREFAAWLGLTPVQKSTGGKQRLGRISRKGDQYIRRLLIIGAQTALLRSKAARANPWIQALLAGVPG